MIIVFVSLTRRDNEWKRKNACLAIILSLSSVAIAIFLFAILYIMTSWASLPLSSSMCQFKCWTSRVWKYRYVLLVPRQVIRKNYLQKKKVAGSCMSGWTYLKSIVSWSVTEGSVLPSDIIEINWAFFIWSITSLSKTFRYSFNKVNTSTSEDHF